MRDEVLAILDRSPVNTAVGYLTRALVIQEYPAGEDLARPQHGYGGSWLLDDSVAECTSGFVARRSSDSKEGVLTAGHCEGINKMRQHNTSGGTVTTFSAPWAGEHIGSYGDIEFHTTTHDDFPYFWATTSWLRSVTGRVVTSSIGPNDWVCHYGRVTKDSCGVVTLVNMNFQYLWEGCGYCKVTAQGQVQVTGTDGDNGDSGGPWYLVGLAFGTHTGEDPAGNHYFTPIRKAEAYFGVVVETG